MGQATLALGGRHTLTSLRGERLATAVGVALAGVSLAVLAYHVALTVAFPYDLDYGEGYVLFDAVRLARGEPIFTDIQQFPMVRSPYPPLFPALWATLVPLAGLAFWPGRLLAALALAGLIGLLFWNARRLRTDALGTALAVSAVAGSPLAYQWAGYARVDTLAVLFSASAVVVAQRVPRWKGVAGAAGLCLLAVWTKQSALAAPLAIGLAFFAAYPLRGAAFGALVVVPSALLAWWLDATSGGQFSRHVLQGNSQNPFYLARLVPMYGTFVVLHLPLLVLAGGWAVRRLRGVPSPIGVYLPVSLLLALSVGNGGSSVNYFLEPLAAAGLTLPLAWRALPLVLGRLAPGLAVLQLALLLHWPNSFGTQYLLFAPHGRTPTAADWQAGALVDAAVRSEPREVLAEPAGFAVRNGRPVYVQPIDLRAEAALGRWSSAPLLEALQAGRFGLVVTAYNLLPFDAERLLASPAFREAQTIQGANGLAFRLLRPAAE